MFLNMTVLACNLPLCFLLAYVLRGSFANVLFMFVLNRSYNLLYLDFWLLCFSQVLLIRLVLINKKDTRLLFFSLEFSSICQILLCESHCTRIIAFRFVQKIYVRI